MEKKMAVLWLRFLTEINEDTVEAPSELLENDEIRKALSIVEKSAMTEAQLYAYERFWDAINVENALAEGRYKRGREEGREEGRDERSLEIARGMKQKGLGEDLIAELTGLSVDEIETL